MNINPINTKAEYEAALVEIEKLFDAKLNTSRGEKFDKLINKVVAYEEKHFPIKCDSQ